MTEDKTENLRTMCSREPEWVGSGAQREVALDSGTVRAGNGGRGGVRCLGLMCWKVGTWEAGACGKSLFRSLLFSKGTKVRPSAEDGDGGGSAAGLRQEEMAGLGEGIGERDGEINNSITGQHQGPT